MKNILIIFLLTLCNFSIQGQTRSSVACIDLVNELMNEGETDKALSLISDCKEQHVEDITISKLYQKTIWELKSEYYHSSSDLELFDEFKSIVIKELKNFPKDSTLTNLLTSVIFDKSSRLVDLNQLEKGIDDINIFLESYPEQKNLIEKFITHSVYELIAKDKPENAINQIDLLLNSKLTSTEPEKRFIQLVQNTLDQNKLTLTNHLYSLSKIKFPDISSTLNSMICGKVSEMLLLTPSINTIQHLQSLEKDFKECTTLAGIEKEHLLNVIKSALNTNNVSLAGKAFQLAKVNFRSDNDILDLKKKWVLSDYQDNYLKSTVKPEQLKWTGNTRLCKAGKVSEYSHRMVEKRVNYFRRLAGLRDSCKINSELNQFSQQAALIMAANNELNHFPDKSWKCYTDIGYKGAGKSNLSLGEHSSNAVTGQMEDEGEDNFGVGHRRWILYPGLNEIGHGSTDHTQALYVFDFFDTSDDFSENFVCWPPEHFVPNNLIFRRWSFTLEDAQFYDVKIIMTNDNKIVPLTIENIDNDGFGDNSIVWIPNLSNTDKSKPYLITISNIYKKGDYEGGNPVTFKYGVEIIR